MGQSETIDNLDLGADGAVGFDLANTVPFVPEVGESAEDRTALVRLASAITHLPEDQQGIKMMSDPTEAMS